jgi:DNA-directed RNA polymerase specialized sigma24 family protein
MAYQERNAQALHDFFEAYDAGDKARVEVAWAELQRGLTPLVRRIVSRGVKRPELVDELVNQTFFQAYRAIDRFQRGRDITPWISMIAVNVARRDWKQRGSKQDLFVSTEDFPNSGEALGASKAEEAADALLADKEIRELAKKIFSMPSDR